MHTSENNVFHITGNTNGFFANQSTDSEFNPEANASYPNLYVTLPAILCGLGVLAYIIIKTIQEFRKK